MTLRHPITGCKNSNSMWFIKDFFGADVKLVNGKPICKICYGEFMIVPEDVEKFKKEKQDEARA